MGEKVVMQTALVSIGCNDKFYKMRALFDTRNTRTCIIEELAKVLKAKSVEKKRNFSVYLFGSTKEKLKTSPVVGLVIKIKMGKAILIKATVTPQITDPLNRVPIQLEKQRKIQKDCPLADRIPKNIEICTLGLLVGNDYYNENIPDKHKKIQNNLYVINSKLGWIISDRVLSTINSEKEIVMFEMTPASSCLLANIHLIFTERTQNYNLPESYKLLFGRLKTQITCFEKDCDLLQRHDEIIKDQLSKGVIEKVEEKNRNRKHYIPHRAGPILENKSMRTIFQKKGKKMLKKGKIFENLGKNVHNLKIF